MRAQFSANDFRETLRGVPAQLRDQWVDEYLELGELPEDDALPRGCVPYLPCSANTLLRLLDIIDVGEDDVFVDVGSGPGRATALMHLLTGAGAIGIEIQSALVRRARALARRLDTPRVASVEGDAVELTRYIPIGTIFFLYCPFSGARLEAVLSEIEQIARTRQVHVCSVDLPIPPLPWLTPVSISHDLAVYRSATMTLCSGRADGACAPVAPTQAKRD